MSYNPKGRVSVPSSFAPRANASNSGFQQSPVDRLGTVIEYGQNTDSGNRTSPTIVVREDETGRIIEAKMSERASEQAKVAKSSNASAAASDNFRGNIIDDLMQKNIPLGDRVVLEGTLFTKGGKISVGGEERSVMECNYITHVTEPSPKKSFRAIFTVKADSKRPDGAGEDGGTVASRVRDCQIWDEQAYSEAADIDKLVAELDSARSTFESGDRQPGRGVQFRVVVPNGENFGKPLYEVLDSSPPFEWVRAERDPNDTTKIITEGYPLDGEEFRNLYSGYKDYIFGNKAEGAAPKFDAETLKNAEIEVMAYHSHMASGFSKYLKFSEHPKHPLRRLCFTPTKGSQDDESYMYGKNWAVSSIVMLTGDQFDKTNNSIVHRDMVRRLFFGGPTGNLHSFVRTSKGHKAKAHLAIDNPAKAQRAEQAGGYNTPRPPSAPTAPKTVSSASQASALFDDDEGEEAHIPAQVSSAIPFDDDGHDDFFDDLLNGGSDTSDSDDNGDEGSDESGSDEGSSASESQSSSSSSQKESGTGKEGKDSGTSGRRSRARPE